MSDPTDGRPVDIPFVKMEGCGNDYVYVDLGDVGVDLGARIRENAAFLSRCMSDRHFGVGADGLVLIGDDALIRAGVIGAGERTDGAMRMLNVDGTVAPICGNALRCVAMHLAGKRAPRPRELTIQTDSGVKRATLAELEGHATRVEVDMGSPRFAADEIPLRTEAAEVLGGGEDEPWRVGIHLDGEPHEGAVLSMGNAHLVIFLDRDPSALDLARLGPPLETAAMFPDRCNIEFVRAAPGPVFVQRTWERGSGETLACGSGACAVAVAAISRGLAGRGERIPVRLRGGELAITWTEQGSVYMDGPAKKVFEGVFRTELPIQ